MTGCKIIDFCRQKSIEIVGIHSVEVGHKAWHESAYIVSMHLLQPVVTSFHPLDTRVIPVHECTPSSNSQTRAHRLQIRRQNQTHRLQIRRQQHLAMELVKVHGVNSAVLNTRSLLVICITALRS